MIRLAQLSEQIHNLRVTGVECPHPHQWTLASLPTWSPVNRRCIFQAQSFISSRQKISRRQFSVLGTISWEQREGNKNQRSETTGPLQASSSRVLSLSLATSSHDCFKISHKLAISPNDQAAAGRISNISSLAWLKVTARTQVFVFRLGSVRGCQIETEQKSVDVTQLRVVITLTSHHHSWQ